MKNYSVPLLIIGLLLYASLSLVVMNHIDGQAHNDCPLQAAGMIDCARVQNSFDFINLHLNTVSKFFSAIPVNGFAISLSLLLLLAFTVLINLNKQSPVLASLFVRSRPRESFVPPSRILLNYWFALHENSPAFMIRR